ncbi:MAG: phytanoyl-CoA dioxygenase family protein [Candidatus Dormibacteria bacterium]
MPATSTCTASTLSEEDVKFFDDFGYLVVRKALAADIGWITDEHAAVFRDLGIDHNGSTRSSVVPFIDQRERLAGLLEHPAIDGALTSLLGPDYAYLAGDGNYYSGDTAWHADGMHARGKFIKLAVYLDPVQADSGALRVIPGTHLYLDHPARQAGRCDTLWGLAGSEVPAVTLDSEPGDFVLFNHNLMHSSWGGGTARRMFTLNCCANPTDEAEVDEMKAYIAMLEVFLMERVHTALMRDTAPPQRMRHLQQVIANESHLKELSRARAERGEPGYAFTAGAGA